MFLGGGVAASTRVLGLTTPPEAASARRAGEQRRIRDIRSLVIASVNNQPVRVEDVVEGGRTSPGQIGDQGVLVSYQTRLGRIGYWRADQQGQPHYRQRPPGSPPSPSDVALH